jgi:hypothetical protein
MHDFLVAQHPVGDFFGQVPSQSDLENKIRDLGGAALKAFSLGDIVSLAFHDRDNQGLQVVSDVNEAGVAVPGGFKFTAMGDSNLAKSSTTRNMAVAAVQASLKDLETMRQAGFATTGGRPVFSPGPMPNIPAAFAAALKTVTPFAAEKFVPREDTSAANVGMDWEWGKFNAEMRSAVDSTVKSEIAAVFRDKASGETDKNKKEAMVDLADHLTSAGIAAIEAAIGVKAGP